MLHTFIPFNEMCTKEERSYLRSVYQNDAEMEAFVSVPIRLRLFSSFWKPTQIKLYLLIRRFCNSSMSGWSMTHSIWNPNSPCCNSTDPNSFPKWLSLPPRSSAFSQVHTDLLQQTGFNSSRFVRCVTMDASCNLTDSLYSQYMAIMAQHEASKQVIRQQYQ